MTNEETEVVVEIHSMQLSHKGMFQLFTLQGKLERFCIIKQMFVKLLKVSL
jgi:hypothetical protein